MEGFSGVGGVEPGVEFGYEVFAVAFFGEFDGVGSGVGDGLFGVDGNFVGGVERIALSGCLSSKRTGFFIVIIAHDCAVCGDAAP